MPATAHRTHRHLAGKRTYSRACALGTLKLWERPFWKWAGSQTYRLNSGGEGGVRRWNLKWLKSINKIPQRLKLRDTLETAVKWQCKHRIFPLFPSIS